MMDKVSTTDIHDPGFWDANADHRTTVNDFTAFYSERAWELAALPPDACVLDVAAGAGPLTLVAAAAGNRVLATDFSQGMVDSIAALGLSNVTARVMDGQALEIADGSFDAAFSMLGIMLFPDWRKGLAEMVRVLRPGGLACISTWAEPSGAAANLLIANIAARKFPALEVPHIVPGMVAWTDRDRFRHSLEGVGIVEPQFHVVSSDFRIELSLLAEPDRLFQFSPVWPLLDDEQRAELLEVLAELATRNGGKIDVASPATIAIGVKQ